MWDIIFLPLLCTLLIECALSAALFRNKRTVYGVFLCNLLTNPLMNAALYFLSWLLGWPGYILGIFFSGADCNRRGSRGFNTISGMEAR